MIEEGDICFSQNNFNDAVQYYSGSIQQQLQRHSKNDPSIESIILYCQVKKSECYLHLNQLPLCVRSCNIGLSIPSITLNQKDYSKLHTTR